jgi:hypothetical protein
VKKLRVILATAFFMVIAIGISNVHAGPPHKQGNPGLPGCLAEIDQLQGLLDAMENYAPVPKTGQTESYYLGDDGDSQMGVSWPDPRFTDNDDGTVTDNFTGLLWTKSANLYGYTYFFSDALTSCSSCDEGGYTDWRLPNVRELASLIDYGQPQYHKLPAENPFIEPSGPHFYYWTSTSDGLNTAYCISFENGFVWHGSAGNVWCVRGGY